jgi:hypothetical protein
MRLATSILLFCLLAGIITSAQAKPVQQYPYQSCFEVAAQMHRVPVDLLLAVAATESNWDADARSHANAHGIMQIQWPGTAKHLGVKRVAELYNPCFNISLGAQYLSELLAQFEGSSERALAAYNYGPTRISSSATLPQGAQRYAARVIQHQRRINAGLIPKALKPRSQQTLVAFNSRVRANRLSQKLARMLDGATVRVDQLQHPPRYAVVLEVGKAGLTSNDHITLNSMGWSL